jgi:competence protein ComEA
MLCLRLDRTRRENWAVRKRSRFPALAIAILSASLIGMPSGTAGMPQAAAHKPEAPPPEARVDINRASVDELMKIPGMTQSWAGRIVRFRPYRSKQDLLDHGVVTSGVYDRIKDFVIAHREKQ